MALEKYYQVRVSPAVVAVTIAAFCGLLAEMLTYVGQQHYFIITTVVFGLGVSWMAATALRRRGYSLLVGMLFGLYMGLIYAEYSLVSLRYSGEIRFGFVMAVIFTLFGIGLSVFLETVFHLMFSRHRSGPAPAAAPAVPVQPVRAPEKRPVRTHLPASVMVVVIIALLAVTTVIQFVYFEKDWTYVYLVMAFDLAVAMVALVLTNLRFFFWLTGVTLGFFGATLAVAGSLLTSQAWLELYSGFVTGIFFAFLGFVVGILAQSIDSFHRLVHEAADEGG